MTKYTPEQIDKLEELLEDYADAVEAPQTPVR